jgi:hypothetical protein
MKVLHDNCMGHSIVWECVGGFSGMRLDADGVRSADHGLYLMRLRINSPRGSRTIEELKQ